MTRLLLLMFLVFPVAFGIGVLVMLMAVLARALRQDAQADGAARQLVRRRDWHDAHYGDLV